MKMFVKQVLEKQLTKLLRISQSGTDPLLEFNGWDNVRINQRRLEHLATLGLDIQGRSVLEVGAGIGNLTSFFVDRRCRVTSTDGREENLKVLAGRFPELETGRLDLDAPSAAGGVHDIVFCYGLLYHLARPAAAIEYLAGRASGMFIMETCVSFGSEVAVNLCDEDQQVVSQALAGVGCRPTRSWVVGELRKHFKFVYLPSTQPAHAEFPTDWRNAAAHKAPYSRAIFIASHDPIDNPTLVMEIPELQTFA